MPPDGRTPRHRPDPPRRWRRITLRRAVPALLATGLAAAVLHLAVVGPLWRFGAEREQPPQRPEPHGPHRPPSGTRSGESGTPRPSASATATVSPSGVAMPRGDLPGWRQVFTEDFPGTALDNRWFSYEGEPDGDPGGWFDPSHVSVGGGMLTIGGWREAARGGRYVTGGVTNRRVASRTYGRFDIRFRMDRGTGIAYALLLWPASNRYPPEIDIAEDNGKGRDRMYGVLHPAAGQPIEHSIPGDFTRWHTAGLRWTPERLVFTLDGKPWAEITGDRVPDEPMALALQSQAWYCGHTWEACPDSGTPPRVDLQVDWVVSYAPA